MDNEILNTKNNPTKENEFTKLNTEPNEDINSNSKLIKNIRPRNKINAMKDKNHGKKEKKKYQISQEELAKKHQIKLKNDIKNIFKSSQFINHNLKSLQKELKINDTIVAIISTIIILLSFIQVIIYKFNSQIKLGF